MKNQTSESPSEAGKTSPANGSQPSSRDNMMSMHAAGSLTKSPIPSASGKPRVDPIRLKDLARDMTGPIGEWAQSGNETDDYPSFIMARTEQGGPAVKKLRYPWEASAQVGFRAVTEKVQSP